MTRFMICGMGSAGRRHLHNLRDLGQEDVVLLRTGRSTLPEEELAGLPVEHDVEAALKRWRPDAVVVATPTALHLDTAIPAARAGCHLLIEKPVSHSLAGIGELQSAVAATGSRVLIGYQLRFHPGLERVRKWLEQGAIGRLTAVRAHRGEYLPGWHPWEDYRTGYSARSDLGGGVVLTLSHPLDYASWLFGRPAGLWAQLSHASDLELGVEDSAEIVLVYAAGFTVSLHLDYIQRPPEHSLTIIGTQGTIRWNELDGAARLHATRAEGEVVVHPPASFERNHLFLEEMRHFLSVVTRDTQPACTLDDGVIALRLALAAKGSSSTGCVVELPS